tara:strand:- start:437 stop:682 length:246 start_codon:yes stop_codon:yes gene_type:complete
MKISEYQVYSKIGCPYCTKVKSVLELAELRFVEYKLGRDFTREEFYSHFGEGATFPRVKLDDTLIGGCTETVKYLKENNLV